MVTILVKLSNEALYVIYFVVCGLLFVVCGLVWCLVFGSVVCC